jgi:hypothetical protein
VAVIAMFMCACATASAPAPSIATAPFAATLKPVVLEGSPTVRFRPDRAYAVRRMETRGEPGRSADLRIYMLVPRDEQSAVTVGIGEGVHRKTEAAIARMYQGAKVTKVVGTVAGKTVEWWHYQDDHHLYSTCYVGLPDKQGRGHSFYFDLVASSPDRLASLEDTITSVEVE